VSRDDFRTFRVDRITQPATLGARFAPRPPPEGGDLKKYVSRSLSTSVYEVQTSLILHAPMEAIADRVSPSAAFLERVDDQRCRLRAGASSVDSVAAWILMLGVDFEVEEPPELIGALRRLSARLKRILAASKRTPQA
jgi:predicted DNA-binding transcriptional regulator YafY